MPWGSCRLDVETRGASLALAPPPPYVCGEVYHTAPYPYLSAQAVKDPEKLSAALGGLMTSWIAVQGMLRIEFAKTIALGISISGMIAPLAQKVAVPFPAVAGKPLPRNAEQVLRPNDAVG